MNGFNQNEEVIDVKTQKINKFFKKIVPTLVVIFIVFICVVNSFYIIKDNENGVVLRFGTVLKVVDESGPHFKVPFIDQVKKVDVKNIYNMEYGFRTKAHGNEYNEPLYDDEMDEATIIVDAANNNASIALIELIIQYKISRPVDYLFKVDDPEGTLRLALEDVVRTAVQSFTLDEAKTKKELIDEVIKPMLQDKMDEYNSGIEIVLVGTQNVQFSENVEKAYQQKENANQYKNTKEEESQRYYNTVIPQAEAEATQLIEQANAYYAETIAKANADVAEFNALYKEYINNPEILKEKYYIEAMTEFLANNKIVVDATQNGNINVFYNVDDNQNIKEKLASEASN